MTITTQAAMLTEFGEPLEVTDIPLPNADPGALLVEVEVTSVCGSDVHSWTGAFADTMPMPLPVVLGHEIVGRVVAIGSGADRDSVGNPVRIGDRIVWEHAACRRCDMCTIQREPTLCRARQIGMLHPAHDYPHAVGGFAKHSYVWPNAGRLIVPESVESTWAAAASCALRTVIGAFEKLGSIEPHETVVIQGAGPLGLFATALASRQGARRVVVGAPDDRLAVATSWGATDVVSVEAHPESTDRVAAVRDLVAGESPIVLELSGAPTAFAEGLQMASPNARYVVVGTLGGRPQEIQPGLIAGKGLRVTGVLGGDIGTYHRALQFMERAAEEFEWDRLFPTSAYTLESATEALRDLQLARAIKPLVRP